MMSQDRPYSIAGLGQFDASLHFMRVVGITGISYSMLYSKRKEL